MEDQAREREQRLRQLKQKIRDPRYLRQAVNRLAGKLAKEYYLRLER